MKSLPRISDAEWLVMRVLWERAPQTANEVIEALSSQVDWAERTTKTLLGRLLHKGALKSRQEGKAYLYYPAVSEKACVRAAGKSFLQRVYGGAVGPMLVQFLEVEHLSPEEISALKKLIAEKEAGK